MVDEPLEHSKAVRWLSPTELLRTGIRAGLAAVFGQYADKREMQQGPAFQQDLADYGGDSEFWFDYVSDVGDGFDATYSVASLLAVDLTVPDAPGTSLPRGQLLVMGGDEVYPAADAETYERRTTKVYAAAFPPATGDRPTLYAVPGNHDWYDGLTSFLRVFAQQEEIGGWATQQKRSYFALRLSHGWWLLAVDIQLDTYIDKPQLDYFKDIARHIDSDASIILCTAKPSWYDVGESATSLDRLAYFLKYSLGDRSRQVRLVLTGDRHHYARYTQETHHTENGQDGQDGQVLVTAGHGGAYTSATHLLPDRLLVQARLADAAADEDACNSYVLAPGTWPSKRDSRREARNVLWRLPTRNGGLVPFFSVMYGLLAGSAVLGTWLWSVLLLGAAAAGCAGFVRPPRGHRRGKLVHGFILAVVELVPAVAVFLTFAMLVRDWSWPRQLLATALAAAAGGVVVTVLLAVWLLVVSHWRVNENELFAAQSIEDYKGFLRIRIGTDGVLTIFPIGMRRVVRRWRPTTSTDGPRLVPADGRIGFELIEPPVRIRPVRARDG